MNEIAKQYGFKSKQYFSVFLFLMIQSLSLIAPLIMGKVIDEYIPSGKVNHIFMGIFLFVLIPFVSILLSMLYNYLLIKYIRKKGNEISIDIMKNLVYMDQSFFDSTNSLEILSYVGKEAVSYVNFYIYDIAQYYVYIIIAIIVFVIMGMIHLKLAFFQILYLPVSILPVKMMMKNISNEIKLVVENNAKINQVKGDLFKAIEYVKVNRLEEKKIKEVEIHNQTINRIWGKISALDTTSGIFASGFAVSLFTGLTFGLGALLVLHHSIALGQLVTVLSYCGIFYSNVNLIVNTDISKDKKEAEYEKLFSYIHLQNTTQVGNLPFQFNDEIKFDHVKFSYKQDEPVLKNINLSIKKGEWIGIIGASGEGKSTILDLLVKLYQNNEGTIMIDGIHLKDIHTYDLREHITKISQDVYLFPGTILDNFKLINENIDEQEINEMIHIACLDEYITSLPQGIHTDIGEAGKLMSGGQKQRLSIALGLARKNKILLLDEVSSNIDLENEMALMKNLNQLKENGYTIISITHQDEFLEYATHIYKIENGNSILVK